MSLYYYKSIKSENVEGLTIVSFKIPKRVEKQNEWIDLERELMSISKDNWLAQEFVNFARRYGVRPVLHSP